MTLERLTTADLPVCIRQDHGHDVDPNLVRLAEAYEVAAAKLGAAQGSASTSAEAGASGGPHVPLGDAGIEGGRVAAEGSQPPLRRGKRAQRTSAVNKEGLERGAASPSGREAESAELPAFRAAARFDSPRPGCVFGRGALGVGYYPDPRVRAVALPHCCERSCVAGAAETAEPSKGDLVARLLAGINGDDPPATTRLPGMYRKAGKAVGQGMQTCGGEPAARREGRRGALPGRLRKKLAKAKGRAGQPGA